MTHMRFSNGVESASFVVSSNLLRRPLETILELHAEISTKQENSLWFKVKQELDLTVIAFVASQINVGEAEQSDLISSSALKDNNFPLFEFLCNHKFPCFSLHKAAISLFYHHLEQLHQLKALIDSSKPLMVTGHALGGSIASLFTLWLLENLTTGGSGRKRSPLCVTFGSPFLGDTDLQRAISRSPLWNSSFLHVASLQDRLPRSFISTNVYKPFGTFLLCSELGSSCFNDPDSILQLLVETRSTVSDPYGQGFHIHQYSDIVQNVHHKAICKAFTLQPQNMALSDSLEASILIQLKALGLSQIQQDVVEKLKLREITLQQKKNLDPSKRLNDVKMYMANLEWYKKYAKAQGTGMYDMYKKHRNEGDQDIVRWKKELALYWTEMVEEAEMKPQREGAAFTTRWLFAGTNYRRMMEPLDIADYYENGGKDYETQGRSKHYQKLVEWLKEDRTTTSSSEGLLCTTNKQNVESILTFDSCFWARVEEALIACRDMMMKSGEECSSSRQKLSEFKEYVYELLKNYAVSPEIFLKYSTYMRWWNEYEMLKEASSDSKLASFMRNPDNYKLYSMGVFDFQ